MRAPFERGGIEEKDIEPGSLCHPFGVHRWCGPLTQGSLRIALGYDMTPVPG